MTLRPVPLRVQPDNIPLLMQQEQRWVVWHYIWREPSEGKEGKWTKPLYIATDPETPASSTNAATWRTFDDALGALEDGKCDGIGFVLGDGWVGFDADDTDAREHLEVLNTYAERSPSGEGVHAIARGSKPGPRSRIGPLELYDSGRYFTVTGHHLDWTPKTVEIRTKEIAILYEKIFPEDTDRVKTHGLSSNDLTDESIIARASGSKTGAKFTALYNGDISGYDNDHSKADAALCSILAYWTNRDAVKMDRLFRLSKLMRPKWDEKRGAQRYGEKTIAHAINNTPNGFSLNGHVSFILASDVRTVKLEWLWHARLALGAITLFEGGPEKGKSTILVDLAARVSTGCSFPCETDTREPRNVIMLIAEDDLQTTVVPRLKAAGADLSRISFLHITKDEKGDVVPFQFNDDCDKLRIECARVGAAFIVVDPLVSYLGSRKGRVLNTNNDLEVRKALSPLKELAERAHCAVAAIRHYRKGVGTDAMEAGGGSVGFAALVRVIVAALPDPEDETKYLLAVAKNNLVAKNKRPALSYEIVPSIDDSDIGCIAWGEKIEMSAGEILHAQSIANKQAEKEKEPSGKTGEALAFLEEFLADGAWKPTVDVMKTAKEMHGLSEFAVRRAKEKVTMQVEKQGRQWFWRLKGDEKDSTSF